MKISKVSWLFLIVGVVVIAALSLGMTHSSQSSQQKQLRDQLTAAQQKLSSIDNQTLTAKQTQLTQDLSKYTAQIGATKSSLTSNWDSIDAIAKVISFASPLNVAVTSIKSSPVGTEQLGGTPCQTLILDFDVQGTIANVRDFVLGLSQTFPTGMVKTLTVTESSPAATPDPALASGKDTKSSIHLVIYTYGGN
jgi:hypothetical protein